jgi:hypothetical protein
MIPQSSISWAISLTLLISAPMMIVSLTVYWPVVSPRMDTKLFFPQLCTSRLKSFEKVAFSSTSFVAGCRIERVKVTWQLQSAARDCSSRHGYTQ